MTLARHAGPTRSSALMSRAKAVEDQHSAVQNARATRTVASQAADAADCGELLAMLGLDAMDGVTH